MSLWKAFIARIIRAMEPEIGSVLRPGICECEHERCTHEAGKWRCRTGFPPDEEWPDGAVCACQIFILDKDSDADNEPETPTPSELEKLYSR